MWRWQWIYYRDIWLLKSIDTTNICLNCVYHIQTIWVMMKTGQVHQVDTKLSLSHNFLGRFCCSLQNCTKQQTNEESSSKVQKVEGPKKVEILVKKREPPIIVWGKKFQPVWLIPRRLAQLHPEREKNYVTYSFGIFTKSSLSLSFLSTRKSLSPLSSS